MVHSHPREAAPIAVPFWDCSSHYTNTELIMVADLTKEEIRATQMKGTEEHGPLLLMVSSGSFALSTLSLAVLLVSVLLTSVLQAVLGTNRRQSMPACQLLVFGALIRKFAALFRACLQTWRTFGQKTLTAHQVLLMLVLSALRVGRHARLLNAVPWNV
jgi:hypothetical protein